MTATNGIRTENKMKRLAAALALALAAVLGASCLSPARADAAGTSDGNLVIDVPTTVPCALMADGTVVSPSEWKITTSGDAYIASASASGFPANVEWSAKTTDLAAAQTESVEIAGTGDAASVTGPSDPASAKLAPSAGFKWAFSKLDAGKNSDIIAKAAGGTAVLGSVTFTFAKTAPDAFAVYSADDNSLSFYKRSSVPGAGQMFESKTATEVYTGIETMTSIPGWTQNHFNDIKTVTVYDEGIAPTGTAFWFAGVRNMKTADVSKLDMSRCKTIECMFTDCISLETLDLSGWDTSSLTNMSQAFHHCASLTKLNVSGWDVSKVTNMQLAFAEDKALGSLDLSTWDNSATTSMKDAFLQMDSLNEISLGSKFKFVGSNGYLPTPSSTYIAGADGKWYDTDGNGYAPANIPSNKAMTYTAVAPKKAFAVYSADDGSLSFYKRAAVPAAGDQFEGKTATEVYEGVEKASYTATDGAPWSGHAADIASVTVADAGVAPVSTAYWFKGASKLKSVNLAGLDTSQTTCMDGMFDGCSSLETLDLSAMSTRRVASMTAFLGGCDSLAELSLGSEFAWVDDDCYPPTGDWKQGSTGTDYSESDIPANKTDKYTRTKTAFAVYSADDNSLTFYKRFEAPAEETQFLGKTATKVFTGFETKTYAGSSSNVPWSAYRNNAKTVTVADEGIAPVSTANWFYSFANVESIDLSKLDTSNVSDMYCMFDGCKALTTLDLSSFDTSNVTNMGSMFDGCSALTALDVSSFDTGAVWNMRSMFYGCKALTTLDVSSFDTSNVTDMVNMFCNCVALTSLDLSSFNTSSVTDMNCMFSGCKALTTLDLSSFDTTDVKNMNCMFSGCGSLTSLNVSSFSTGNVTNMYGMFYNCGSLTSLNVSSFSTGNTTDMRSMFYNCAALTSLDLSSFDTSNVSDMYCMFDGCKALTTLDLSSFDTSNVTNMGSMFYNCGSLPALDVSHFDTSNVTNMDYMFYGCKALAALDVLSFDTRNVSDMGGMFYGCAALSTLDLTSFDTAKVTDMSWMFNECKALTALDVSSFSTENVSNMGYMFRLCPKLQKVTFGADWKRVGTNGFLPTPSSAYIAGADGKWYDTDGNGYAPADIPSNKAMTYTAVAPKKAFAVYSADDGSLNFYKRSSVPTVGDAFEGKTVTAVYTGIESSSYNNTNQPWKSYRSNIETARVVDDGISPSSCAYWFYGCSKMKSADVGKLDVSKATDLSSVFDMCSSLTNIEGLSDWDVGNATKVVQMFAFCSKLTSVGDLSNWDVSNVVKANGLFAFCSKLTSVGDLSNWDVSNVDTATMLFYKCSSIKTFGDLSRWNTSNMVHMQEMFEYCTSLTSLGDLSGWNTSKAKTIRLLFNGCTSLTSLEGIGKWDTSNVEDSNGYAHMAGVFEDCSNITKLDLSNWSNAKTSPNNNSQIAVLPMFGGMTRLQQVTVGEKWEWKKSSIESWLLPAPSAVYIPGADGKWYAKSTGIGYTPDQIPSFKADTYYATKALRDAAVGAASDPTDDEAVVVSAANSTKAQNESATENDVEGEPSHEEIASNDGGVTAEPEGAEKDAESKPEGENEATKEDVSAIVPEGAGKATAVKSGE